MYGLCSPSDERAPRSRSACGSMVLRRATVFEVDCVESLGVTRIRNENRPLQLANLAYRSHDVQPYQSRKRSLHLLLRIHETGFGGNV